VEIKIIFHNNKHKEEQHSMTWS